jgi:hypothetical protein
MARLGLAVYAACVDFLLRLADWLHITYRDANAGLFFLLWPLVTALLLLWVGVQALRLWHRQRSLRRRAQTPPTQGGQATI